MKQLEEMVSKPLLILQLRGCFRRGTTEAFKGEWGCHSTNLKEVLSNSLGLVNFIQKYVFSLGQRAGEVIKVTEKPVSIQIFQLTGVPITFR